jgi:hypothetical protein
LAVLVSRSGNDDEAAATLQEGECLTGPEGVVVKTLGITNYNYGGVVVFLGLAVPTLAAGFLAWAWLSGEIAAEVEADRSRIWLVVVFHLLAVVASVALLLPMLYAVLWVELGDGLLVGRLLWVEGFGVSAVQGIHFEDERSIVEMGIPGVGLPIGTHRILVMQVLGEGAVRVKVNRRQDDKSSSGGTTTGPAEWNTTLGRDRTEHGPRNTTGTG